MKDVYVKINALINKAAHTNTPIEEARSCALAACRLIKKHEIELGSAEKLVSSEPDEIDPYMSYDRPVNGIPVNPNDFTHDIQQYRIIISKAPGQCGACKKQYLANTPIAEGIGSGIKTHFTCKRFFVE